MLAYRHLIFMTRSERIDSTISNILEALRRIWAALKDGLAPAQPEPVPVPVRKDR